MGAFCLKSGLKGVGGGSLRLQRLWGQGEKVARCQST